MECASCSFASALGFVVLGRWDRAVCAGRVCPGPLDELGQERVSALQVGRRNRWVGSARFCVCVQRGVETNSSSFYQLFSGFAVS